MRPGYAERGPVSIGLQILDADLPAYEVNIAGRMTASDRAEAINSAWIARSAEDNAIFNCSMRHSLVI
jgi:hypothetical protein